MQFADRDGRPGAQAPLRRGNFLRQSFQSLLVSSFEFEIRLSLCGPRNLDCLHDNSIFRARGAGEMGHVHLVGKGKFTGHVMKRPGAAQSPAHKPSPPPRMPQQSQIATMQSQMTQMRSQIALQNMQIQTNKQAQDAVNHLENDFNTWQTNLNLWLLAVLFAQERFQKIMDAHPPPNLLGQLVGTALTALIFVVLPEMGPLAAIASKLSKEKEVAHLVAVSVSEVTKGSVEQFKKKAETDEEGSRKVPVEQISVKFFSKLYRSIGVQLATVTNTKNALVNQLKGTDPTVLMTQIPLVLAAWAKAGFETNGAPAGSDHEQLGLIFLYDIMKDYTKKAVELRIPWVSPADDLRRSLDSPDSDVSKKFANALGASVSGRYDVPISKKEFLLRRKENPDFDVEFEGLDSAKREKMYEYFAEIKWSIEGRPRILAPPRGRGWLDLIQHWDFKEA
jgi:hypothetical protein